MPEPGEQHAGDEGKSDPPRGHGHQHINTLILTDTTLKAHFDILTILSSSHQACFIYVLYLVRSKQYDLMITCGEASGSSKPVALSPTKATSQAPTNRDML